MEMEILRRNPSCQLSKQTSFCLLLPVELHLQVVTIKPRNVWAKQWKYEANICNLLTLFLSWKIDKFIVTIDNNHSTRYCNNRNKPKTVMKRQFWNRTNTKWKKNQKGGEGGGRDLVFAFNMDFLTIFPANTVESSGLLADSDPLFDPLTGPL